MGWSFRIGKIAGIEFRIHVTFFLLLLVIFVSTTTQAGMQKAWLATLFISAVFVCVLIHEIGHSLIARRFGKEAKSITLLPIGGVASLEEIPEKPGQEIAMAVVGPLINLAIAGVLYLFVGRWSVSVPSLYPSSATMFFAGLIGVNVWLAIFNMIPAFPMDGGRVLRGFLALTMDYVRATAVAVMIGQGIAMFFILFGIFYNWWLVLIGLFLYIGAGGEKRHVMLRSVLRQVPASEAMTTKYFSLHPDDQLSRALEQFAHGCQDDFPVIGDHGIEGILTRQQILAGIYERGLDVAVADLMDRSVDVVRPETALDEIYKQLQQNGKSAVVVAEGDSVKGMICLDSLSRFILAKSAVGRLSSHPG
ncbi:MAG: site-2 protease family protein [Phycisphaerales bacterium]|nr:MAG: site-2 protease family protein [Phycisphaerales bacterium]